MIHAIIRIIGGEVMQKRKIKLKRPAIILLWVLGGIFACLIVLGIFYSYQIHSLTSLGYSKKASHQILLQFKKKNQEVCISSALYTFNKIFCLCYIILKKKL